MVWTVVAIGIVLVLLVLLGIGAVLWIVMGGGRAQ